MPTKIACAARFSLPYYGQFKFRLTVGNSINSSEQCVSDPRARGFSDGDKTDEEWKHPDVAPRAY